MRQRMENEVAEDLFLRLRNCGIIRHVEGPSNPSSTSPTGDSRAWPVCGSLPSEAAATCQNRSGSSVPPASRWLRLCMPLPLCFQVPGPRSLVPASAIPASPVAFLLQLMERFTRIRSSPGAPIAQLDRATASGAVGQRFESSWAHHSPPPNSRSRPPSGRRDTHSPCATRHQPDLPSSWVAGCPRV